MRYSIVDAFTDRPFAGNPAAVVLLDSWPSDVWLQNVAMEMNHAETAFLVPEVAGYALRWFTPKVEVDLCGHATLASAKVLAEQETLIEGGTVAFSTRSGILAAKRTSDVFELDFPLEAERETEAPTELVESLGVRPWYVGRNRFDYLVELGSETEVRSAAPDIRKLAGVPCRGVILTARSDTAGIDFVSRFFAPACGIDEDPVTGSAHCCLADFWGRRLNKSTMVGFQASARGGTVRVEVRGRRVLLAGQAVVVCRGELLV
jgi:predicted PhzF superfamily epimerase YddE/YHI9